MVRLPRGAISQMDSEGIRFPGYPWALSGVQSSRRFAGRQVGGVLRAVGQWYNTISEQKGLKRNCRIRVTHEKAPVKRQHFPMHNCLWLCIRACVRMTRLGRANRSAPLGFMVVVSAPHLVRTRHPAGSRPRKEVPSGGLPPRPWPSLAPGNRPYHPASTEGEPRSRAPRWVQPLAGSRRRRPSHRT